MWHRGWPRAWIGRPVAADLVACALLQRAAQSERAAAAARARAREREREPEHTLRRSERQAANKAVLFSSSLAARSADRFQRDHPLPQSDIVCGKLVNSYAPAVLRCFELAPQHHHRHPPSAASSSGPRPASSSRRSGPPLLSSLVAQPHQGGPRSLSLGLELWLRGAMASWLCCSAHV